VKKRTALTLVDPKDETEKLKKLFDELLQKTNKNYPKDSDVAAFRKLLGDNPNLKLYERTVGVMGYAESFLLQVGSPLSPGLNEVLREKQREIRKRLGYDEASEMEKLLITHAALCWLRLGLIEIGYSNVMSQSITLTLGAYWEKRLLMAQKRFERACEALERVRRLARTAPGLRLAGTKVA
jgi:hypothetical protein